MEYLEPKCYGGESSREKRKGEEERLRSIRLNIMVREGHAEVSAI